MEGREGREKFGRPNPKGSHVGRTNKNIAKKKNFMMIRQKVRFGIDLNNKLPRVL